MWKTAVYVGPAKTSKEIYERHVFKSCSTKDFEQNLKNCIIYGFSAIKEEKN